MGMLLDGVDSTLISAYLCEVKIRMGRFAEADDLIKKIPAGDNRIELEALRKWAELRRGTATELQGWETVFLAFNYLGDRRLALLRSFEQTFRFFCRPIFRRLGRSLALVGINWP